MIGDGDRSSAGRDVVWLARISSRWRGRAALESAPRHDPALFERLREAADAARRAADRAGASARAANDAATIAALSEGFGERAMAGSEDRGSTALRAIDSAREADDGAKLAAARGRLAQIAAEEARREVGETSRDGRLGQRWKRPKAAE